MWTPLSCDITSAFLALLAYLQALFAGFLEADKACRARHRVSGTAPLATMLPACHSTNSCAYHYAGIA
jgi:hypothetical protein